MAKKLKFKPIITRIKLNPEQAVIWCVCFTGTGRLRTNRTALIDYCLQTPKSSTARGCAALASTPAS
jgi:hypothetical protein